MLGRKARFVIAKFLTGMLDADDLRRYIQETMDPSLLLFAQRVHFFHYNILVPQENGTATIEADDIYDHALQNLYHTVTQIMNAHGIGPGGVDNDSDTTEVHGDLVAAIHAVFDHSNLHLDNVGEMAINVAALFLFPNAAASVIPNLGHFDPFYGFVVYNILLNNHVITPVDIQELDVLAVHWVNGTVPDDLYDLAMGVENIMSLAGDTSGVA